MPTIDARLVRESAPARRSEGGGAAPRSIGYADMERKERLDEEHAERVAALRPKQQLSYKLMKLRAAEVFVEKVKRYAPYFESAERILEIGAGTGWASHLVKSIYPEKEVIATDLASAAVERSTMWQGFFDVSIDDVVTCPSYETPFEDDSFDLVFCFEAAHHFGRHRRTLTEIKRILRPDGRALYLHEPGCPRALYRAARWRALRKRPAVREDVIVPGELAKICRSLGLNATVERDPLVIDRKPMEALYYEVLSRVPLLDRLLPCTFNMQIEVQNAEPDAPDS